MTITLIIIIVTVIISFLAMNNNDLMDKLIFHPYSIAHDPAQWYRAVTCGFIHADFMHLAFNMFSFYMFGDMVEKYFEGLIPQEKNIGFDDLSQELIKAINELTSFNSDKLLGNTCYY